MHTLVPERGMFAGQAVLLEPRDTKSVMETLHVPLQLVLPNSSQLTAPDLWRLVLFWCTVDGPLILFLTAAGNAEKKLSHHQGHFPVLLHQATCRESAPTRRR